MWPASQLVMLEYDRARKPISTWIAEGFRGPELIQGGTLRWPAVQAFSERSRSVQALRTTERLWPHCENLFDFLKKGAPLRHLKLLERDRYFDIFDLALRKITSGTRVLDAGGGIGRFSLPVLRKGAHVDLLDFSKHALTKAFTHLARESRRGSFDLIRTNLDHAARCRMVSEEAYDVIFAVELISYVDSPERVMNWLAQMLKPGGYLCLSVENPLGAILSDPDISPETADAILKTNHAVLGNQRFTRYFDAPRLHSSVENSGLEIVRSEGTHYVLEGPFDGPKIDKLLGTKKNRDKLLAIERKFAVHPLTAPLARAWALLARKP